MTNKKFKVAAMSMALTACVAAQPLLANAADNIDTTPSNDASAQTENAPADEEQTVEPSEESGGTEAPVAEPQNENESPSDANEGQKNADAPDGQNDSGKEVQKPDGANQEGKEPEDLLGDADVKYDHENPEPNGDGTTIKGEVIDPSKKDETDPDKDPGHIGDAEKTETDNDDATTTPPTTKPGAQPEVDPDKDSSSTTEDDGTIIINTPTRVPATEETTSTGKGEATADMDPTQKEEDLTEDELQKELGGKLPTWETSEKDTFGEGDDKYEVIGDKLSEDGKSKDLTLKKTTSTTTDMTAEDIAKLLEAEATEPDKDGNYTLTRDKVETTDENGNKITRITYITVDPGSGKVTTRTVTELTVTVSKGEGSVDQTTEDADYTYPPKSTVKNGDRKYEIDLKDLLEGKDIKPGSLPDEPIQVKRGDLIYTITFGEEDDGTEISYSADDLANMLGDAYESDGENLYYVGDNGRTKLTIDEAKALQKSLSIKVKVTDTKGSSTSGTVIDGGEEKKDQAEADAKLDAIKNALVKAAANEGLTIKAEDIKLTEDGKWTYTSTDGKTKYTFTYVVNDDFHADGRVEVDKSTIGDTDHNQIDNVWENKITGTAYVSGSTITSTGEETQYETGKLGDLGSDFKNPPKGAADIEREGGSETGRITKYVKDGKTYTFKYSDFNDLPEEEKAALRAKAEAEGKTLEEVTANLTKVEWEIWSNRKEEHRDEEIKDAPTITVSKDTSWSKTEEDGKYSFTYKDGTASGLELASTSEDGLSQTFTKTDEHGTKTTITVTTRHLTKDELTTDFNGKFGEGNYTLNYDKKTVTYTVDGKTYTAKYDDSVQTLNVEVVSKQEVAGTGNTEADAIADFLKNLEKAYKDALDADEELILHDPSGKRPDLVITPDTDWEEVRTFVKSVVNFKAMSDADLIQYLEKQKSDAKDTSYSGSTRSDTLYYVEGNTTYRVTDTKTEKNWWGQDVITEVFANGAWHKVERDYWGGSSNIQYGPNKIGHLDLATDSKLTLDEKDDAGNFKTDDCVLIDKTLEWNNSAKDLVEGKNNKKVGLLDRITYDNENDNDPSTGHYEYPRASWDDNRDDNRKNNAPTKSTFYKVTGTVAYGKHGGAYEATATGGWYGEKYFTQADYDRAKAAAEKALDDYKKAHPELDLSKAQVVEIYKDQNKGGERYYQIYLYESNLTAYGYLSDASNTCGNAHYDAQNRYNYVGGYDLTLGSLTQVSKEEIVAIGRNVTNCSATFDRVKRTMDQANKNLTYVNNRVVYDEVTGGELIKRDSGVTGTYQATYKQEKNYGADDDTTASGSGTYLSYQYTDYTSTETEEQELTATRIANSVVKLVRNVISSAAKTETVKKDAKVTYTYKTVETRDTYVPGEDQITIITPDENGGGDDGGELIKENTPILPSTPELPPVQDARPDAPVLPSAVVLPPVQDAHMDAALPQTGVNWLTAIGLALSGMTLTLTGAFATLTGKNKKEQQ